MEIVLKIESKNYAKVKDILLTDDIVSRSSLIFKEGSIIGKKNYYCYLSGREEQCKRALELIKEKSETGEVIELAKEANDKEKKELINKIKEEEDKAIEGFGNILG
jgi:precorrin-3B methylase